MKKVLKNFLAQVKQLSLTSEERTATRMALLRELQFHDSADMFSQVKNVQLTAEEKLDVRKMLQAHITATPKVSSLGMLLISLRHLCSYRGFQIAMALVLLITFTGGSAYAAESALPGEFLYPVKRYINEPIISTLQVSPMAQAQWSVTLFNRRLEEVALVTKKNPKLSAEAERDLLSQSEEVKMRAKALKSEKDADEVRRSVRYSLQQKLLSPAVQGKMTDDRFDRIARSVLNEFESSSSSSAKGTNVGVKVIKKPIPPSINGIEVTPEPPDAYPSVGRVKEKIKKNSLYKGEPLPSHQTSSDASSYSESSASSQNSSSNSSSLLDLPKLP